MTETAQPIPPITLPPIQNPDKEEQWLKKSLHTWLDEEFIPEMINEKIAQRAAQIFVRSFYSEFAIANAVSDLILDSLGIDRCCGDN